MTSGFIECRYKWPIRFFHTFSELGVTTQGSITSGLPMPERLTASGLPLALSKMLAKAVRLPPAEDLKVTLIVQAVPAGNKPPQVSLWTNLLVLAPVITRLVSLKAPSPVSRRLTVKATLVVPPAWLSKVRAEGPRYENVREGTKFLRSGPPRSGARARKKSTMCLSSQAA